MPDPLPPSLAPPLGGDANLAAPLPRSFAAIGPMRMPTLMLVEDSRYASEVMRLYARALGLRLRRAPDLATAQAHLRLYRPDIVLIDLGLPDGRGEALIADLAGGPNRPPLLIATSGEGGMAGAALAAGADLFLEKPMPDIAQFRALLVDHFPSPLPLLLLPQRPSAPSPDRVALQDDLDLAARGFAKLAQGADAARADLPGGTEGDTRAQVQYLAGFLQGVGGCLGDHDLQSAAHRQLLDARCDTPVFHQNAPSPQDSGFRKLSDLVNDRLRNMAQDRGI
jgi:CheY-like chemotaxis protein